MRALVWILALFGLAVAVALGARHNEGYLLLVLPPWRAEISLNLFVLALLLLFLSFYAALRFLLVSFGLPKRVRRYREQRRRELAGGVFQDAVRLLFEGRYGQALKKASEAHAAGTAPGLSALIAARAAQRMRESQKQQGWLERAKLDDPRTETAALMLEAEMMSDERRFDTALLALKRLQKRHGRHIAALRIELRARQGAGDWDGVLKLLRQLDKRDALSPEMVRGIRNKAHLANIARLATDERRLVAYLRALPDGECGQSLVAAAARALARQGVYDEAQKLIEKALDGVAEVDEDWLPELTEIYGRLAGADQTARIAKAEAWLLGRPDDAGLLLALGRMCIRQRLWGKAQSYLEASLSVDATAQTHLELAHLFDQLEKPEQANRHYRASAQLNAA